MPAPVLDDHLGLFQRVKDFSIKQLISEPAVKALVITVLPRAAGLDKRCFNLEFVQPVLERFGCELGPVVRPDIIRHPLYDKQITEHIQNIIGFEFITHTQRQTLARVFINHRQDPDFLAVREPLGNKIVRPHMVLPVWSEAYAGPVIQIQPAPLLLFLRDFQALFTPDALHPFMVYPPAFGAQQGCNSFIPVPTIF